MAEAQSMPTVRGIPEDEFNPEADAMFLHAAMKGLGTNDRQLITLITDRTNAQRLAIAASYEEQFEQALVKRIQRETSGKYERCLVALMIPPAHYDAYFLRQAMDGIGTTESLLNEILCTRMGSEIEAIKVAFEEQCGKNLADRVAGEIGFGNKHYEQFLLRCITNPRADDEEEVDDDAVNEDAERLAAAGVDKWGTDEGVFIDVFASRSFSHLKQVCIAYQSAKGHTLESAVKSELGGHFEDAIMATLGHAFRPSDFWGEKIKDTMKGLGTNDQDLIRLVVARSERDLGTIRDNFGTDFGEGQTLEAWVAGDTSGKYEQVLLAIIGADQREPLRTEGDAAEPLEEYEEPVDSGWQNVPGLLCQVTAVRPGEIYGVNSDGAIYHRQLGTDWVQIPGVLTRIDCGGPNLDTVWGVNGNGNIFTLRPNRTDWEQIAGILVELSVGQQGQVWGVNGNGDIYCWRSAETGWEQVSGILTKIACDAVTGQTYGIGTNGEMYYRAGVTEDNILGDEWVGVPSEGMVSVSACSGKVVGTNSDGVLLDCTDVENGEFIPVDADGIEETPTCLSIGVSWNLAATNESQLIFTRENYFGSVFSG